MPARQRRRVRLGASLRRALGLLPVLSVVLWLLVPVGAAQAKEPPNQNDPCSSAGRDTCGTTGVGFYTTYKYGIRWFGDYRGAVPGAAHTFCIDLQYWYPSPKYRFRELTADTLKNREGETVSLENRRRIAYAMWAYGRSGVPRRQAAVMLYVHGLMGDARPGEADPAGVRDDVAATHADVARDSARYHGPYRVEVRMPSRLRVGQRGTATIRVLSATGAPLPDVELTLSAKGTGVPSHASTGANGTASVVFVARTADGVTIAVRTEPLASTLPIVYAPTTQAAAPNGQRLAVPSSQVVTGTSETDAYKAQAHVSSVSDPPTLTLGGTSRDRVTIAGVDESFKVTVTARLYGPFRSTGAIRCDGKPAWEGTWQVDGPGRIHDPAGRASQARLVRVPARRSRERGVQRHQDDLHRPARAGEGRRTAHRPHAGEQAAGGAGRPDHGHGDRRRARRRAGDGAGRPLRPVPH